MGGLGGAVSREYSEAWEPRELWGSACPGWCSGRADGWWDVVPGEHCLRAPRVLLRLNDKTSEQRRTPGCSLGWTGASATMTCACSTRTAGSSLPAGSAMGWRGGGAAWVGGRSCRAAGAGGGGDRDRAGPAGGALLAAGCQVDAVNPRWSVTTAAATPAAGPSRIVGMPRVLAELVRTDRHNHRQSPVTVRRSRSWPGRTRA
jgi:hypothetical protein